ncbi:MAG TPA: heparan-alpha-glucosaminide N-acetyltransferase domain-containing protein [Cyclobacteriaceae bacterium]|nr:heparan-alpha-glucosaminide N-acetyltransferase domain-containing protein [Cyclobacteriaceae bacterium]
MSIGEKQRVSSIDLLRGLIMVVMVLDHTRDYFHSEALLFDPTNLEKTTPVLFATRWITHFCAPAFALLSGISININLRKRGRPELVKYLLTRGLWLVILDLVVLRFGFFFQFYYDMTFFSILWMLGWCMVLMAVVIFLPYRAILVIAIVIIAGHDALNGIAVTPGTPMASLWTILMSRGFVPPAFISSYAIIPWLAIMMFGFVTGRLYGDKYDPVLRRRLLLQLGILSIVLFVLLRWANVYGDPSPWSVSDRGTIYTIISFFNVTKYAVSLLFTLMTVGPLLVLLSLLETDNTRWLSPAAVFGRVPLFYFLLHFYLIHAAALIHYMWKTGKSWSEIDLHYPTTFGGITAEGGVSLVWVYVAWVLIVLALYPICKWYDHLKRKHGLTYL